MNLSVGEESRQAEARCLQTAVFHDEGIPTTARKTLLIVDDEPALTELLSRLVEGQGYQALTAHSGEEALNLYALHSGCIALVITDLNMPGMGGEALIEALLRLDTQTRILVVSGSCTRSNEEALQQRGVRGVLHKPYPTQQLFRQIQGAQA